MRIFIQGDFTKDELFEILLKVREIEQKNPQRRINISVHAPELGSMDVIEMIAKVFPHWAEMNYCEKCKMLYKKTEGHICE